MELSNPRLKKFLGGNFPILKNKKKLQKKKKKEKKKKLTLKKFIIFSQNIVFLTFREDATLIFWGMEIFSL